MPRCMPWHDMVTAECKDEYRTRYTVACYSSKDTKFIPNYTSGLTLHTEVNADTIVV